MVGSWWKLRKTARLGSGFHLTNNYRRTQLPVSVVPAVVRKIAAVVLGADSKTHARSACDHPPIDHHSCRCDDHARSTIQPLNVGLGPSAYDTLVNYVHISNTLQELFFALKACPYDSRRSRCASLDTCAALNPYNCILDGSEVLSESPRCCSFRNNDTPRSAGTIIRHLQGGSTHKKHSSF